MFISKKRLIQTFHAREERLVQRINDCNRVIRDLKEQIEQLESFTSEELIEHSTNKILNGLKEVDFEDNGN